MQALNILYAYAGTDPRITHYIQQLAGTMRQAGHQASILSSPCSRLHQVMALKAKLQQQRYDVVNTHSHVDTVVVGLAARLAKVPVVVRTYHHTHDPLPNFLTRRLASQTIAASQYLAEHLQQSGTQVTVIYDGVNAIATPTNNTIVVGSMAPLVKGSGAQETLQAMTPLLASQPTWRLLFMGQGERQAELVQFAHQLGVAEQVNFIPYTESELAQVSLLVSVPHEADTNRDIALAAAAHIPTVATQTGANLEMIQTGKSGMLVPQHDVVSLRKAIQRAVSDTALVEQMGQAAYEYIVESGRFSTETMQQRTEQVYRQSTKRHN